MEEKIGPGEKFGEKMKSWIFDFGKAEIGLGTAIFGISVKNYRGYRNSRPNPLLGGLFRGRLKISILDMVISNRKPCLIIQSEPLCENCPACRNSKPPLGNFRTKTKRQFFKINTVPHMCRKKGVSGSFPGYRKNTRHVKIQNPLGNFHTKTERQFLNRNTVYV